MQWGDESVTVARANMTRNQNRNDPNVGIRRPTAREYGRDG